MHKKTRIVITFISQPLILSVAGKQNGVQAEEISFGVMPSVTQIITQSGMTAESEITIKNNHNESITLNPLLQPFKASNRENGEVSYEEKIPNYFRFITILADGQPVSSITLGPHEEKTLRIQLQVPESETSTDYYFSLILLTKPQTKEPEEKTSDIQARSTISGGVASHFLVTVNPTATRSLKLSEFSSPVLSQSSPVPFHVRIGNEGNHFTRVISEIRIENLLGMEVETVKIPPTLILAHSTRSLGLVEKSINSYPFGSIMREEEIIRPAVEQQVHLLPGVYRAKLSISAESGHNPINSTHYFTVAPIELLTILFFCVLFLILIRNRLKKRFSS